MFLNFIIVILLMYLPSIGDVGVLCLLYCLSASITRLSPISSISSFFPLLFLKKNFINRITSDKVSATVKFSISYATLRQMRCSAITATAPVVRLGTIDTV